MALEDVLGKIPGLAGYLGRQEFDQKQALEQIQQASGVLSLANAYQQREEASKIRGILSSDNPIEDKITGLSKAGPAGIALSQHLLEIQKGQSAAADAARQAAVRNPAFVSQFMTKPTAAIQPDPQEAQQAADYGTPAVSPVSAKPGGFDAQAYLNAAAARGGIDPLALAKERLAEAQPKFAPRQSPGYMQNGQWIATPGNQEQWSAPYQLQGAMVQRNLATGQVRTAVTRDANPQIEATPQGLKSQGAQVAAGMPLSQVVPGYGRNVGKAREAARMEGIAQIKAANPGLDDAAAGTELANRQIDFVAGKKSVGQLTTMLGATRQAVAQLDFNVNKVTEQMDKLGNKGNDLSPVINAIVRGQEKWTGDPAYSALYFYMHAAAMESARILQGGQASIAQLHQGAADEARKWASVGMTTPKAWKEGVAPAMRAEGHARLKTYTDAIKAARLGATSEVPLTPETPASSPDIKSLLDKYK